MSKDIPHSKKAIEIVDRILESLYPVRICGSDYVHAVDRGAVLIDKELNKLYDHIKQLEIKLDTAFQLASQGDENWKDEDCDKLRNCRFTPFVKPE